VSNKTVSASNRKGNAATWLSSTSLVGLQLEKKHKKEYIIKIYFIKKGRINLPN
jgi:hypothetical protein